MDMENLNNNLMEDLKVSVHDTSLVFPAQEQEILRKSMFLSNIDQVLNFDVQTIHFFPSHPRFPPETIAPTLRRALSKLLSGPYHFLSGRLSSNPETGRLEFDCNSAGAGFVVASSDYTLDDIGDLVYPHPAFAQLVTITIPNLGSHPHDQPLCILQVTSFKCGGFAMGISTSHSTFDGLSFKVFLQNLAAVAADADRPLPITPCNDRHLLAARSPPKVTFSHPELRKLNHNLQEIEEKSRSGTTSAPVFDNSNQDLDFKIFRLTSKDIAALKDKAKSESENNRARATGFNVVTAHVWRCKALSNVVENDRDTERESRILYAVDIRGRLKPPLPQSYAGNAVLTAYATAKWKEMKEEMEFGRLVELVTEGGSRMSDEYARSAIDWGEMYKGFPDGEVLVSSWWRLGFEDVEYPWGKPRYSCPLVYRRKDIILLFPDIHRDPNSVNVLVALPKPEMDIFQHLFYNFLPSSSSSSSTFS